MAPIKFEENIKDKLEKRTLSPSPQSWSKLNERLDTDEKKSKKPMFWWFSIAAAVLLMMAISVQFYSSDDSEQALPQMVEEKIEMESEPSTSLEKQIKDKELKRKENKSIKLANQDDRVEEQEEILPTTNKPKIVDYKKATRNIVDNTIKLAVQNDLKEDDNSKKIDKKNHKPQQSIIDDDLINEALLVAKQDLKNERLGANDREVDSLLKVASKALLKENLNKEITKTVDAKLLLESVEDEMGQSFRSKVFEALEGGYKTVKTAVVNRNN